ncbi:MAG TPA: hypothetical protein V6D25_24560 [Leptolyngbyaceae cyanobacterium]
MTYETQPKPLTHPEVDSTDWETQMARLVGLAAEPTPEIPDVLPSQPSPTSPQEVKTEQPLSSNPFAKLALVGTGTLVLVMVAGVFLSQLMGTTNNKPAQNSSALPQPEAPATNFTPQENLEQQVETLKTKLALAEQTQAVKVAQQNLRNAPRVTATPTPQTNTPTRVSVNPVPQTGQQATPSSPARTVIVERVGQNPYMPPIPPIPPINIPSLNPQLQQSPVVQANPTPTPPSPWEQWKSLAKIGSYGQANPVDQPSMTVSSQQPVTAPRPQQAQIPNSGMSQGQPRNPQAMKVGTTAKGILATGVFGESARGRGANPNNNNNDDNDNKSVFVIRLTEPLKGADGAIAIPANTELLAELRSVSDQGLMQINLTKMIVQNNGVPSERDIPNNALIVRGSGGTPLIARQYPDRGGAIASMDFGLFVLGGVAKGAELYNRTESQVTYGGNGNLTTVTTGNNRRNFVAGVLEGGLNSVVPQISQRNQQAVAQMMQQGNIWLLQAGTPVEIYVNQAVQL